MALAFVPSIAAPTLEDARRVAEVLVNDGAATVLVYGSVARGCAAVSSDIDLVAVFDDLGDYSCRADLRRSLIESARKATGATVDVWVTDRPEWHRRTTAVTSSFEAAIASSAVVLAGRPPERAIDWEKEIGMPPDNRAEALERLQDTKNALVRVLNGLYEGEAEQLDAAEGDVSSWADARYERMAYVCTDSQQTIENAFKTVAALAGITSERIHSIQRLAKLTLEELEATAIELTRMASQTAAALAAHFAGASDAATVTAYLARTIHRIETGLTTGDIGNTTETP